MEVDPLSSQVATLTLTLTQTFTCGQYMKIALPAEMSMVGPAHLEAVQDAAPAPEGTPSDLLDGLLVAQDLLWKTLPQDGKPDRHDRRIILARAQPAHRPVRSMASAMYSMEQALRRPGSALVQSLNWVAVRKGRHVAALALCLCAQGEVKCAATLPARYGFTCISLATDLQS